MRRKKAFITKEAPLSRKNFPGIVWKLMSCLCFASMNGVIKNIQLPIAQISCLQNLLAALFMWRWIPQNPFPLLRNPLYWMRSAIALAAVLLWIYGLKKLPLFQAAALGFLSPFVTLVGARLFLYEQLTWNRILAVILAIWGGLCISYGSQLLSLFTTWPKAEGPLWAPIAAAAFFAIVNLMTKALIANDPPLSSAFSLLFMVGLALLSTLGSWSCPTRADISWLLLLGALTAGAHLSLHQAIKHMDLTLLIPLGATRAISIALIGWFFFKEKPTEWMWIGTIIIMFALSLLNLDSSKS